MTEKNKRERGQSLVELALSFTFLLLILSGAVDIGRAFFSYIAVRDAAQEGAVYGALYPKATDVEARVRNSASAPVDLTSPDVTVAPSKSCPTQKYSVTVTYWFEPVMPLTSGLFGSGGFPIRATVDQTILNYYCT